MLIEMKNLLILNCIILSVLISSLLGSSKPQIKMLKSGVHTWSSEVSLPSALYISPPTGRESSKSNCHPGHVSSSFPEGRHQRLSNVFLKTKQILSVALPLSTSLPTLSQKEMRLVGHILFLSKPTFREFLFTCTNRLNGMFISESGKFLQETEF